MYIEPNLGRLNPYFMSFFWCFLSLGGRGGAKKKEFFTFSGAGGSPVSPAKTKKQKIIVHLFGIPDYSCYLVGESKID
jgi:hypothetical protein